jgi:hypothetical protein
MNILTINLAFSTLVFWVAAKLYVLPKLQDYEAITILLPILLLHSLRHLGLMFLAPGATFPGIPPQFTHPAAYGDLTTAVLAMISIPVVAARARSAKLFVWVLTSWARSISLTPSRSRRFMMQRRLWAPHIGFRRFGCLR